MSDEYVEYYAPLYFKAYDQGISKSYKVNPDEDKKIPSAYKNPDHYTVWCYHCACYMCYHNEPGTLLDGYSRRILKRAEAILTLFFLRFGANPRPTFDF